MLISINEDEFRGESENEEGNVSDWELSSVEMNDDKKLSNLMMQRPLFM